MGCIGDTASSVPRRPGIPDLPLRISHFSGGRLWGMWETDRSAARGFMACRGLFVFSHDSTLGNAPAHELFARLSVRKRAVVVAPRSVDDYDVLVNEASLPSGVVSISAGGLARANGDRRRTLGKDETQPKPSPLGANGDTVCHESLDPLSLYANHGRTHSCPRYGPRPRS